MYLYIPGGHRVIRGTSFYVCMSGFLFVRLYICRQTLHVTFHPYMVQRWYSVGILYGPSTLEDIQRPPTYDIPPCDDPDGDRVSHRHVLCCESQTIKEQSHSDLVSNFTVLLLEYLFKPTPLIVGTA